MKTFIKNPQETRNNSHDFYCLISKWSWDCPGIYFCERKFFRKNFGNLFFNK